MLKVSAINQPLRVSPQDERYRQLVIAIEAAGAPGNAALDALLRQIAALSSPPPGWPDGVDGARAHTDMGQAWTLVRRWAAAELAPVDPPPIFRAPDADVAAAAQNLAAPQERLLVRNNRDRFSPEQRLAIANGIADKVFAASRVAVRRIQNDLRAAGLNAEETPARRAYLEYARAVLRANATLARVFALVSDPVYLTPGEDPPVYPLSDPEKIGVLARDIVAYLDDPDAYREQFALLDPLRRQVPRLAARGAAATNAELLDVLRGIRAEMRAASQDDPGGVLAVRAERGQLIEFTLHTVASQDITVRLAVQRGFRPSDQHLAAVYDRRAGVAWSLNGRQLRDELRVAPGTLRFSTLAGLEHHGRFVFELSVGGEPVTRALDVTAVAPCHRCGLIRPALGQPEWGDCVFVLRRSHEPFMRGWHHAGSLDGDSLLMLAAPADPAQDADERVAEGVVPVRERPRRLDIPYTFAERIALAAEHVGAILDAGFYREDPHAARYLRFLGTLGLGVDADKVLARLPPGRPRISLAPPVEPRPVLAPQPLPGGRPVPAVALVRDQGAGDNAPEALAGADPAPLDDGAADTQPGDATRSDTASDASGDAGSGGAPSTPAQSGTGTPGGPQSGTASDTEDGASSEVQPGTPSDDSGTSEASDAFATAETDSNSPDPAGPASTASDTGDRGSAASDTGDPSGTPPDTDVDVAATDQSARDGADSGVTSDDGTLVEDEMSLGLKAQFAKAMAIPLKQPPRRPDGSLDIGPAYSYWIETMHTFENHIAQLEAKLWK